MNDKNKRSLNRGESHLNVGVYDAKNDALRIFFGSSGKRIKKKAPLMKPLDGCGIVWDPVWVCWIFGGRMGIAYTLN